MNIQLLRTDFGSYEIREFYEGGSNQLKLFRDLDHVKRFLNAVQEDYEDYIILSRFSDE